ncbi:hypothetical protein HNQ91_000253 [Filimonas zeae]|uniref:Lipoprotein n=1 Tax=Filimonas zeae TaxID=1737353 RepID=A0A917INB8_9BACT|nr:hypothetical protein [Filimonas zeae]MDR6337231.1 hypothetical protein [Filimonas zeae]GGH57617.1 hypothetical protein GCM10011379_02490 [Filimonas zeae]
MSIQKQFIYPLVLCGMFAGTTGCTRVKKRKEWPVNRDAGIASVTLIRHNFMDSVAAGDELTPEQIKRSTIIDSMYRKEDVAFRGDTVYKAFGDCSIALLDYNDKKNCTYKFLLVYKGPRRNTDYTIVQTDCDEDLSADFSRTGFQLLSDSSFSTREDFYKKLPEDSVQVTATIRTFVINKEGLIEPVKTETEKKPVEKREE